MSDDERDSFLVDLGGSEQFDLKTILDDLPDKDGDLQHMATSKYVDSIGLIEFLLEHKGEFTVGSLNAQSLYAKHTKLSLLVRSLRLRNCAISAICIQECFFSDNNLIPDILQIPDYELIPQDSKMGRNHGLAVYVHNDFKPTMRSPLCIKSDEWEALFLDIKADHMKKPVTLGNIYRRPASISVESIVHREV